MFREAQNPSLHQYSAELLLPMVAENEYTNCNYWHHILNFVIYLYNCVNGFEYQYSLCGNGRE